MKYERFPCDEELIKLLKKYKSIKTVLYLLGKDYGSSIKLSNLAKQNNIKLQKNSYIICTSDIKKENILGNNYIDDYEIGNTFNCDNHKWVIQSIKQDTKKLYHCINELGFKSSFHSIDIRNSYSN